MIDWYKGRIEHNNIICIVRVICHQLSICQISYEYARHINFFPKNCDVTIVRILINFEYPKNSVLQVFINLLMEAA